MTDGYYSRIWATAMMEITSNSIPYQNFVQDPNYNYTVEDALNDPDRKYIVKCVWDEMQRHFNKKVQPCFVITCESQ